MRFTIEIIFLLKTYTHDIHSCFIYMLQCCRHGSATNYMSSSYTVRFLLQLSVKKYINVYKTYNH